MKKQIPNIITLLNLFSGCIAIVMAFNHDYQSAFLWIVIAAIFDFFDGFIARKLGTSSKLGIELDSLSDVVSFGVAPASALFVMLSTLTNNNVTILGSFIPYISFLIPVFSAYRLAKFNIDDRQTTSFLGLPTPANGLFWISYTYGVSKMHLDLAPALIISVSIVLIISLSILMISELPMFSLKLKEFTFKSAFRQIITILFVIVFVSLWGISGVSLGIIVYILLSLLTIKRA